VKTTLACKMRGDTREGTLVRRRRSLVPSVRVLNTTKHIQARQDVREVLAQPAHIQVVPSRVRFLNDFRSTHTRARGCVARRESAKFVSFNPHTYTCMGAMRARARQYTHACIHTHRRQGRRTYLNWRYTFRQFSKVV